MSRIQQSLKDLHRLPQPNLKETSSFLRPPIIFFATQLERKEEGADTLLSFSYSYGVKSLCRLDSDHFTAVVIAASLTSSVRQAGLAALRASDDTGDRQFPVGAASFISSCAGNFSLRYCHFRYTSLIEMPFRHIVYFFLSSSCCRTANLESGSLLQSQGPSLRFLPQRKQSPLQSSRHSSF